MFLSPLALPSDKGGFFFATTEVASEPRIDWLDLYIPANPFRSLANNVVPAVVVFSILLGVAILGVPGKERILGPSSLVNDALGRAGSLLVKLTPYGLFAIAGHSAGTLRLEEFERLQAFLLVYVGLALILTLWLLPGLVSALTGLSYRRIVSLCPGPPPDRLRHREPVHRAPPAGRAGQGPPRRGRSRQGGRRRGRGRPRPCVLHLPPQREAPEPRLRAVRRLVRGRARPRGEFPSLAGAGLLSLFGSLNTAVPFLLDLVRLPADLFQLFVVSSVVNSRFGSAAAAMHTFALALLGAHLMAGRLRVDRKRLLGFAAASLVLVGGFLLGSRLLLDRVLPGPEKATAPLDRLRLSGAWGVLAPVGC